MLPSRYFSDSTPRLIDRFLNDDFFTDFFNFNNIKYPAIQTPLNDIIETDDAFVVESALAGVKKENISLDIDDNILTIKAERKDENEGKYNRKETYYGKFQRSFTIPDNVDIEKIDASFTDGILKLSLPKLKDSPKLSKTIEIK